jgi:hypothetical protein
VKGTTACQKSDGQAQVSGLGRRGTRVIWRKLDCLKPSLQTTERLASAGKTPETGAMLCDDIPLVSTQPSERGALPSEGNQGDERDAYVTLGRMTGTNAGSPAGREPHGDGGPIVVVRVTPHQGGRESRPQGLRREVARI